MFPFPFLSRPDARQPCLSSSSDDHPLLQSCLGAGMRVESQNKFCHFLASLVHSASAIVFTSLSVCWWGSITILLLLVHIIRTFATVTTPVLGVLVNTLQYHDTVNFVHDSETEDPQPVKSQYLSVTKSVSAMSKDNLPTRQYRFACGVTRAPLETSQRSYLLSLQLFLALISSCFSTIDWSTGFSGSLTSSWACRSPRSGSSGSFSFGRFPEEEAIDIDPELTAPPDESVTSTCSEATPTLGLRDQSPKANLPTQQNAFCSLSCFHLALPQSPPSLLCCVLWAWRQLEQWVQAVFPRQRQMLQSVFQTEIISLNVTLWCREKQQDSVYSRQTGK